MDIFYQIKYNCERDFLIEATQYNNSTITAVNTSGLAMILMIVIWFIITCYEHEKPFTQSIYR